MKEIPLLRCLYFEDEDDAFAFYEIYFKRALKNVADLEIERAKTPEEAYQKLESQGNDLNLFFADLLVDENAMEGLQLVEYVTNNFPHVLVIGVSKADGTIPGSSRDFKRVAGPDSVFFDKYDLKERKYTFRDVVYEIMQVAPRKGILTSAEPPSVESPNAYSIPTPEHGLDKTAKYVFLDIVGFTRERSVNAQADIIWQLNTIVSETIKENEIGAGERLFLPTGDGLCVVLFRDNPIDIDIQIALGILKRLEAYNAATDDETRKFQVRIGIESGEDVLVADINGRQNIAGEGINTASRTMDLADGGQILVGERVYSSLKFRDSYPEKFRHYPPATVKHGRQLSVYQFIGEGHAGLSLDPPDRLTDSGSAGLEMRGITHGSLVELFGLIQKRIGQVERLRIYANATTNVQPIFANSIVQAQRCELILREPSSDEPDSANFLQHLGHMLKQWDDLKRAGRISKFEWRRSNILPTEWQIIFDDAFIICGLNVPDRSDWLGIAEMEPLLIDNSTTQGKLFIDKYVERFDRFFELAGPSPVDK